MKLNCIFLIDDDELTNLINKMIIKKVDCAEKTISVQSGRAALDYLNSKEDNELPDLILLDINMPAMNGWEFIEKYRKIQKPQLKQAIVIILTTSSDPKEEVMAKSIPEINGFKNKPLTHQMIEEIIEEHFTDLLKKEIKAY
jgi:CheY-like chemotaxis protein